MCLILFHYAPDGPIPLTVMANRDEFHYRGTLQAGFWEDNDSILAGRDLEKGGTWMGVSRESRFAAVTNYRSPADMISGGASRGELPRAFLEGTMSARTYMDDVLQRGSDYTGFNLLVFDGQQLIYGSNRAEGGAVDVTPGLHGLSNALLDTPWPKVTSGVAALGESLRSGSPERDWLQVLSDQKMASDAELPDTGIGIDKERELSSRCIDIEGYGTRCSSFVRIHGDGRIDFAEKTRIPSGLDPDTVRFSI